MNDWFRSPEFYDAFDKWLERKAKEEAEEFEHSREFRNARAAYRKRIQGS